MVFLYIFKVVKGFKQVNLHGGCKKLNRIFGPNRTDSIRFGFDWLINVIVLKFSLVFSLSIIRLLNAFNSFIVV